MLTAGAIFVGTRSISRIAAVSWIVYSVPHLVYHLRHLTMVMPGADKVGMVVSLSLPIVAAVIVLFDRPRLVRATVDPAAGSETAPPTLPTAMSARNERSSRPMTGLGR